MKIKRRRTTIDTISIRTSDYPLYYGYIIHADSLLIKDTKYLINRVRQLEEVLSSIACISKSKMNTKKYWLAIDHEECADTLSLDTKLARIALEEE